MRKKTPILLLLTLFTAGLFGEVQIHQVKGGETLFGITKQYDITLSQIKSWNALESNTIYTGQKLIVSIDAAPVIQAPQRENFNTYVVKRGDTLWGIARKHNMSLAELRQYNGGDVNRLRVGQEIKVAPEDKKDITNIHVVKKGETLEDIAYQYGMKPQEIMEINNRSDSRIFSGERLYLTPIAIASINTRPKLTRENPTSPKGDSQPREIVPDPVAATEDEPHYTVQKGDTLYGISRKTGVSVADLRIKNNLVNDLIKPGQKLILNSLTLKKEERSPLSIPVALSEPELQETEGLEYNGDTYYNSIPLALSQPDMEYRENPEEGPWLTYQKAFEVYTNWKKRVQQGPRRSQSLEGYHFVIDPGHGGLDPGAIVESIDGRGNTLYVVEDEYVYDTGLRLAELLIQNGAEVTLTVLSPNHTKRETHPAGRTLVHQTNEVYNLPSLNIEDRPLDWPRGGHAGLEKRVIVAQEAFSGIPEDKRVFISLHADNAPEAPKGTGVLYLNNEDSYNQGSAEFAQKMVPYLGYGAHTRGQDLAVLRDNPASIALLIELRNMSYKDHSWAIRFAELRQRDAEKITEALLELLSKT